MITDHDKDVEMIGRPLNVYGDKPSIDESLPDPLAVIQETAKQLQQWANESVAGGWSTHQVSPMRQKAKELYAIYSMHMAHLQANASLLVQAAEIIEEDASILKACHSVNGIWAVTDDLDVKALKTYEHNMTVAMALRAVATGSYKLPFHVKQG